MSTENITAFLNTVKASPELQARVAMLERETVPGELPEKLVALAAEQGLPFTVEEYRAATGEMDDAELGNIAGGIRTAKNFKSPFED